ncbi:hypothetical protein LCGC14_1016420 [marine sediment metagenome]|uniref:Phospholipid/glycerol acyltransferase domain-containing protein n=1 Tax=marine sediment metagenome TaxID=412755 RepID=A0A0F9NKC4_9ZZZZ
MVPDKEPLTRLEYWLGYAFLRIFHRFKVIGKENVPMEGGLVITSNHASYYDPPVVGAAIFPRRAYYMAKSELFKSSLIARLLKRFGAFPVKRDKMNKNALKFSMAILKKKRAICVFPQGSRQRETDTSSQEASQGAAFLALKTGSQILPVRLIGTENIMPPKSIFPRPARITVVIGKPFLIKSRDEIGSFGDRIMKDIYGLKAQGRS